MTGLDPLNTTHLDLQALPAVGLEVLVESASLQRRFDRKFVVQRDSLPGLLGAMVGHLAVLEVDGRRSTDYTSIYFDTDDLRSYRDHAQRRRRRFKVRTRHYGDPGQAMLELKCKGRRQQTVKYRWPHPGDSPFQLSTEGHGLVDGALREHYGFGLPSHLRPSAETRYERITLLLRDAGERVTIDLGLSVCANGQQVRLGRHHAVVETKAPERLGQADRALRTIGIRPERVSKYCVGVAASHEAVRGNLWMPVLRRLETDPIAGPA